jgi:hypothetical protein
MKFKADGMRINQSNLVTKLLNSLNDPSEFWQYRIRSRRENNIKCIKAEEVAR